jgi:hypothetical protein
MIQIVCGEDVVSARNYITKLKKYYRKQSYLVQEIVPADIYEIQKAGEHSATLFEEKRVFFVRNLAVYLSKSRKFSPVVKTLASNEEVNVIDWEEGKSAYELSVKDKKIIKEFKPGSSIFNFLDSCIPNNRSNFFKILNDVLKTQEEMFLYVMLCKHIRSLILAKSNSFPGKVAPWQKAKLLNQSKKWDLENLIKFYEALGKVDRSLKTGQTSYSLKESLEILAMYFL